MATLVDTSGKPNPLLELLIESGGLVALLESKTALKFVKSDLITEQKEPTELMASIAKSSEAVEFLFPAPPPMSLGYLAAAQGPSPASNLIFLTANDLVTPSGEPTPFFKLLEDSGTLETALRVKNWEDRGDEVARILPVLPEKYKTQNRGNALELARIVASSRQGPTGASGGVVF